MSTQKIRFFFGIDDYLPDFDPPLMPQSHSENGPERLDSFFEEEIESDAFTSASDY